MHCREALVTELDKLRNGSDLAARLLRAGSAEQPMRAARNRAARALGLSGVAASALLSSKASAAVATAGVGSAARFAVPMFVKWLALGMLAGGAVLGAAAAVRNALEVTSAARGSSVPPVAMKLPIRQARQLQVAGNPELPEPAASAAADELHANGGASSGEPLRPLSSASGRLPSQPSAAIVDSPPVNGDALLSHEIELLERVRVKLRAGNSGEALAELNAVSGDIQSLMTEADLLRVEALLAHGERAGAEALAEELRRRGGGQNFRLKRLLGRP